jgi:hypothetical protein
MRRDLRDPGVTRTFVLGAGFSVAAGLPLTRDLRGIVAGRIEHEHLPRYHQDNGRFNQGLNHVKDHGRLGLEELLIALKRAATNDRHPAIDTLRALKTACGREFWHRQNAISNLPACYQNFAEWVNRTTVGLSNAVVTFNWDLVAELSVEQSGANFTYGLQYSATGLPRNDLVPVLKPHGSINWSDHTRRGLVSPYGGWTPIGPDSQLAYDSLNPFANPFRQDDINETRWMLFPGDKESIDEDHSLKLIWDDVERVVAQREMLVFIGYSMPRYDEKTRDFFRECGRGKLVEIYTRTATNLSGFHDVFGSSVVHYDQRFEDSIYGLTTPRAVASELGLYNSYQYS